MSVAAKARGGAQVPVRLILAIDDEAERSALVEALRSSLPECRVSYPRNIAEVEGIYSSDGADAIVTDFRFHGGALADWLTLWPLPSVILV
ncbi:MAG: hypothetical protein Q8M76_01120, partial [Spirochaetaceae bacterium]|nr:hypothetical protein [Spirochaetaceae bacterium]